MNEVKICPIMSTPYEMMKCEHDGCAWWGVIGYSRSGQVVYGCMACRGYSNGE